MKKYLLVVLLFSGSSLSVTQSVDYQEAARQISQLLLDPAGPEISRFQGWYSTVIYLYACRTDDHVGLLDSSFPSRCVYLNHDDEPEETRSYMPLFAGDDSIKFAARYFTNTQLNPPHSWIHYGHSSEHYESLCLAPIGEGKQACLVATDTFTHWAALGGAMVVTVLFIFAQIHMSVQGRVILQNRI